MLITKMKSKEALDALKCEKAFVLICHGCKEVHFPEHEADEAFAAWKAQGIVTGSLVTDYVCNPEQLKYRLSYHAEAIEKADSIFVLSCGVGVQTVAALFPTKKVYAVCDTFPLPGYQGVTPLQHDCDQCGECYLNITGGICPLTACSKSLLNGQCGGCKDGRCEVDASMECGWERIYRRLAQVGRLDALKCPVQIRNYATDENSFK